MTNLSQWFDLAEQKPWEVGVYEVQRADYDYAGQFSLFKNGCFHEVGVNGPDSAVYWAEEGGIGDGCDVVLWRGLSTNPEVKKREKIMNKQKTMYAVIPYDKDEEYRPVAVFENKEVAEKRAEYLSKTHKGCFNSIKYMVHAIRFRTPEAA